MNIRVKILWILIIIILVLATFNQCNQKEPKVVTKTVIGKVTDTITKVEIKYVEKIKTIKGKDSIIYKEKPNENTLQANRYKTELKANNATAKLNITTTGELLDLSGTITYPKETKTIERTIIKNKSAFFIYGKANHKLQSPELGILYNIKNKVQIGAGAQYNNFTNAIEPRFTLAIKL